MDEEYRGGAMSEPRKSLEGEFLFSLQVNVAKAQTFGTTPLGGRRLAIVSGGHFEGPRLRGSVEEGGTDWIRIRTDGVRQLDVRLSLRTHDGCMIALRYEGYRLASDETLATERTGVEVPAAEHWYRVAAFFEVGDERYDWLNRVTAIGLGTRTPPAGPVYDFFSLR
jgi:hypothetical protein